MVAGPGFKKWFTFLKNTNHIDIIENVSKDYDFVLN